MKQQIEQYIETKLKPKYAPHHIGLVHTHFEEDLEKGRFFIFIDRGAFINHQCIHLSDIQMDA